MRSAVMLVGIVGLVGCGRLGFDDTSTDAGSDASSDALARTPCPPRPGQLFCDSFEGTSLLTTVDMTSPGFIEFDPTRSFGGAESLHALTTTTSTPSWRLGSGLPDIASGPLYARWWLYVPSSVTTVNIASTHLVEPVFPFYGVVVGIQNNRIELSANGATEMVLSPLTMPRDRWACFQLHIEVADDAGSIETWLDGELAARITDVDTLPSAPYRNVHTGIFSTGVADETQEAWTDELAIGTQPIDCD